MENIRIGKLDFQDIKDSLKNFLSQQTEFKDYNFEGSNLSQLLNILAYNAHYNALTANFLANEVFLDTAVKRSSVVSRAKELGYTSRSRRASSTKLNIKIRNLANQDTTQSVLLPKGTRFTTKVNDEQFIFTTIESVILEKQIESNQPVFVGSTVIYEGVLTQNTVTYNGIDTTIAIPDVDVDTSTLKVEVYENNQWVEWTKPASFLSITADSNVYLIQEGFNGYEIYFGDGVLGKKPGVTNVRCTYVVTSGPTANGAKIFTLASNIQGIISNTIVELTAEYPSAGGLFRESIDSIKLNARNLYGTQNRAVIADDYAALAQQNFEEVKEVLAWDGANHLPPRYGKVILCVKPRIGDVLSSSIKAKIAEFLHTKSVGNIKIDFIDPDYLNVDVESTVKYSAKKLQLTPYELEYLIKSIIINYAGDSIQKFKGVFRYSSLVSLIDDANYAVVGNETILGLNKELKPNLYTLNNFIFTFGNHIHKGSLTSTQFNDGTVPNNLFLQDSNGAIHVYYSVNGKNVIYTENIGTIDYITGKVIINDLYISNIDGPKFKISAKPVSLDIYSDQNLILKLSPDNIKVNVIKETING